MKILMLSWEYPPLSVGGLARHVEDLALAMAKTKNEVHVITRGAEDTPEYEILSGVHIHRFQPYPVSTPDFLTWSLQLNIKMLEFIMRLIQVEGSFDIVHAHDWLAAFAGTAIKHAYQIPLIATIHATEAGRNHGLHNDQQRYISSIEWWLTYEAWKVIVCSKHMRTELKNIFNVPEDKLEIIPNGVDVDKFKSLEVDQGFKKRFAADYEKIVFFVGRLVQEKGVQVLIQSAPTILRAYPNAKFIIAGKGPMSEELKYRVKIMGLEEKVYFAGYIDDETRNKLYSTASVAVFPSLYEPFGIVALEGMAAKTPVVVSDVGGLSEIITHGVDGLKAYPGNANSLANNIIRLLTDEVYAAQIEKKASQLVRTYDWNTIAADTLDIYSKVLDEYRRSPWKQSNTFGRVWDFALSKMNSREKSSGMEYEKSGGTGSSHENERYDLVNYRIASHNRGEGGE